MTRRQMLEKGYSILRRAELHLTNRAGVSCDHFNTGFKTVIALYDAGEPCEILRDLQVQCSRQIAFNVPESSERTGALPLLLAVVLTGLLLLGIPLPAKAQQPIFLATPNPIQFADPTQERFCLRQDHSPDLVVAAGKDAESTHSESASQFSPEPFRFRIEGQRMSEANCPDLAAGLFPCHQPSRFFTKRNTTLLTASAISLSLDALSTQRIFAIGGLREINPVLRQLPSRTGTSFYFAGTFAAETGAMYFAHKRGWRCVEWLIPTAVTAVETFWVAHNYKYKFQRSPQEPTVIKAVAALRFQ